MGLSLVLPFQLGMIVSGHRWWLTSACERSSTVTNCPPSLVLKVWSSALTFWLNERVAMWLEESSFCLLVINSKAFFSFRYNATALSSLIQSENNEISWSIGVSSFITVVNTAGFFLTSGSSCNPDLKPKASCTGQPYSGFHRNSEACIHLLCCMNLTAISPLAASSAGLSLLLTYLHWDRSVLSRINASLLAT